MKKSSVFYANKIKKIMANIERYPWAFHIKEDLIKKAEPWVQLSDDELWSSMFGNTIKRSWSVWSDGYCPSCKKAVPMYSWISDPFNNPWKMQCPHCSELFPKNDFYKYYISGIDKKGVFSYSEADATLLFNCEHPELDDPLHKFGVDAGDGYAEGENRWRFIGSYLIYGQWKKFVLKGICQLAAAYIVTQEKIYAHKAGILLDRVADLYPTFDFANDGVMFEGKNVSQGYVSYCVDACIETRQLVIAYDQIFDGIKDDTQLISFISDKTKTFTGMALKNSFEDIQKNIENNILIHALENQQKTECNYPHTDITYAIIRMVLDWPCKSEEIKSFIGEIIKKTTAVDGLTGEKGLATYSAWTIQALAEFLGLCDGIESNFLKKTIEENPQLHNSFRFHIDTWCLQKYYPLVGDTGNFAQPIKEYLGVLLNKNPGVNPSMYTFLWNLYEVTGDSLFVKVLFKENNDSIENLPYDLCTNDAGKFQRGVSEVINREGKEIEAVSTNKEQWHLAVLSSGRNSCARSLWVHYDCATKPHAHIDGLSMGLYAKGLDLMPDFGYPPVQYGGWYSPSVAWYQITASHNTVVVDGKSQVFDRDCKAMTTLWSIGKLFKAIRISGTEFIEGKQYERTIIMVDISLQDSYVIDIFRVIGGKEHTKFMYSHFGKMTPHGLNLISSKPYGNETIMKNCRSDANPSMGWSVDISIQDHLKILSKHCNVHLRYTDITEDAQVSTAEAWVALGGYNSREEAWIPCVMTGRKAKGQQTLASTFVEIIEPYEDNPNIIGIRRLRLMHKNRVIASAAEVAIEVSMPDEKYDLIIAADSENSLYLKPEIESTVLFQQDWNVYLDCELCIIRKNGHFIERIAICKGSFVTVENIEIKLRCNTDFIEIVFENGKPRVVSGNEQNVEFIKFKGI
jgi:hypothetical protein